jgi:hypothetical protein
MAGRKVVSSDEKSVDESANQRVDKWVNPMESQSDELWGQSWVWN